MSIPESADLARSPTDMSLDWIRANADAAFVSFVLGVATFGLRQMLGLPDPDAGAFVRALQASAEVIAAIAEWDAYIRSETLADSITRAAQAPPHAKEAPIGDVTVKFRIEKV